MSRHLRPRTNPSYTAASPFELAKQHGFTPGNWRKRADDIIEMVVTNAQGTFSAWYRATPRGELFVHDTPGEAVPRWVGAVRMNPGAGKAPDPMAFLAANDEAKIMATLMPEQLWSQASGAGSEWAMWELQRRGQMKPWVRTNPSYPCDVCKASFKNTADLQYTEQKGGVYACRPCLKKLSTAFFSKQNPRRIVHNYNGCIGRGYWLTVVELDDARHTARVLYNARRDDYDAYDSSRRGEPGFVKPPGERLSFQMERGLGDVGNKVAVGGYSPIVSGEIGKLIPRSEYSIEGPFFVGSGEGPVSVAATNPSKYIKHLAKKYAEGSAVPVLSGEDERKLRAAIRKEEERMVRGSKCARSTRAAQAAKKNPRQVTGPDACSRCEGTGYAGMHGDTCSRCEGSGRDDKVWCEGGCGKKVRESKGTCDTCQQAEDDENDVVRDRFGYPMRSLGGGQYRNVLGKIVTVRRNPKLAGFIGGGGGLRLRDLTVHGSGPLGGYRGDERAQVPSSMFLKPSTRSWPVSDEAHAHIALQYMTRGFGSHNEYPSLIRRLAKLWPVNENPDIWADYSAKKSSIETACGCRLPALDALRR